MKCKAYVSDKCQESLIAMEILKKSPYSVEFINITESMEKLGEFLTLRDNKDYKDFFDMARSQGRVGVPLLVFGDNQHFFDVEDGVDLDLLKKYFEE